MELKSQAARDSVTGRRSNAWDPRASQSLWKCNQKMCEIQDLLGQVPDNMVLSAYTAYKAVKPEETKEEEEKGGRTRRRNKRRRRRRKWLAWTGPPCRGEGAI